MALYETVVVKAEDELELTEEFNNDEYTENSHSSTANKFEQQEKLQSTINLRGNNDDEDLKKILRKFDLEILYSTLKNAGVTFRSLKYLSKDDITEAIEHIGYRAEFREKLFHWRKSEYGIDDAETLSNNSKVIGWLNKEPKYYDSPASSNVSQINSAGLQPLSTLLKASTRGKRILEYYEENTCLVNKQRDLLIQIIIEEVQKRNAKLAPSNFNVIVEEIISLFPKEKTSYDYYYISRQKNKNPSGKLYFKYCNLKTKIRKLSDTIKTPMTFEVTDDLELTAELNTEIDETMLSLKVDLKRENDSCNEIYSKWQNTFALRQKDLKTFSCVDFLKEWPMLNDPRAPHLINLDFDLLYPEKRNILKNKWNSFKHRIANYYGMHVRNQHSKDLLLQGKATKKADNEDYIFAILLNSVLLPSAIIKSTVGNSRKKPTIQDANESFVLQIPSVNDALKKIDELNLKYYGTKLTPLQPFIIAEGCDAFSLKSFFVFFDETMFKFDSFIDSLDMCFKIFHILNLKYPKICEMPWFFIQKYLYEIETVFDDVKNPNLTSLLNYMHEI